ncbi:UvrD-helicase domain-containing protein [uncultured Methylobacterium sp.]|uniref:UvrD-helicase domain-containing protein n=1 Tax=uncultured Methylobacterium sp. TaxID=157278 RepID=UPI002592BBAC|nr:UvrD-helicase domain-containing protein [uncultured Methylobacterium sp.]
MHASSLNRVDTTLASAGTGKTTTLVGQLIRFLDAGIAPDRILATTFTKKAAEELIERTRAHLIARGRTEDAIALSGARMGTVNAVCGHLVEDFAFELGRPAGAEVVPDDSAALLFATAADDTLTRFAPALNALGERFGLSAQETDWRGVVRRIIGLARANGIDATGLARSADRSRDTLLALFQEPDPTQSADDLDAALSDAIRGAQDALDGRLLKGEGAKAASAVKAAAGALDRGEPLPWALWAKLAKAKPSKADAPLFADVVRAAAAHSNHPRLRQDLDRFIRLAFDCAAEATAAFQAYKAERGLLDFTDQEALALEILRQPDTQERLRESIEVVLVDEVQDASPLQVAIFTELARIAGRSAWVGDPKQAIYGFRNSDANLTLVAAQGIAVATGGASEVLSKSWRSRPGICAFVNDAFLPAFERMGLPGDASRFTDCTCDDSGLSQPPLTVWHANGRTKADRNASLAGGIAAALAEPARWPVRSGPGRAARDLRPSDIAVLCRYNDDVGTLASALTRLGVAVAVERGDLFATPEVELAMAALRWTADPGDRLSLAELVRLVGGEAEPRGWLDALGAADPDAALEALLPFAKTLRDLRAGQLAMTPCEIVDAVILATGVVDLACRWGRAASRLHALEAFRGVACSYEGECTRLRRPATLGGLVAWLPSQQVSCPRSHEDAVHVMTYHSAKGLEWPVVVLAQLESAPRTDLFEPVAEVDGTLDWRAPLAGRWIRFWPWPYGAQSAGLPLDTEAAMSAIGRKAAREARDEAVRLLYVGATRARDHLVFARNATPAAWLGTLDVGEDPQVILPMHDGRPVVAGGNAHPARFELLAVPVEPVGTKPTDTTFLGIARRPMAHRPLRLKPSGAVDAPAFAALARTPLGDRLPLSGAPEMDVLGQAVHAFLAADRKEQETDLRRQRAVRVLERWNVAGHIDPGDLVEAADRLWSFLARRFPHARIRREVPVFAPVASQFTVGRIDLLVDWGDAFAIVDHKSFPGRLEQWEGRAVGAAPQLAAYAQAVAAATGAPCTGLFVHMPLVGTVIEVGAAAATSVEAVLSREG